MLERKQRAAERVLGPTLRIGLDGIVEETIEGGKHLREQWCHVEFANQVGGFRHDEVVAVRKSFAQRLGAKFFWLSAEGVERGDLIFEVALAGHESSVAEEGRVELRSTGQPRAAVPTWASRSGQSRRLSLHDRSLRGIAVDVVPVE